MNNKIKVELLKDKYNKKFFFLSVHNKYNYKQYILKNDLLYTFFLIINFLHKYGFIKIRKK